MRNSSLSLILLISFSLSACKKDPPMPPFKFYDGIGTLSIGQSGLFYLKDTKLPIELKFIRVVSDSRCPEGVQCFWAGAVSVEILLDKSVSLVIPSMDNPTIYKGYKIVVTNAMPYPKSGISIKERDYKVEFKIFK